MFLDVGARWHTLLESGPHQIVEDPRLNRWALEPLGYGHVLAHLNEA